MALTKAKEISEDWFERYLVDHGVDGGDDHHPDLGVSKKPDYRISRDSSNGAICEVKEFTTSGMEKRFAVSSGQPMSLSDNEVYGAVRRKISDAAEQLKPVRDRDEALVVVLANPRRIHVPIWRVNDIVACMYGNQGYSMPINVETGEGGPGEHVFLRDGALTGKHRYISAVATLHHGTLAEEARQRWLDENRHRWEGIEERQEKALTMLEIMSAEFDLLAQPEGDYFFVRVYSTLSTVTGKAAPVPRELFNGPRDQYWAVNPASKTLELVHGQFD
jgi:hypothetical protein